MHLFDSTSCETISLRTDHWAFFSIVALESRLTFQLNSLEADVLAGDEAIRKEINMKVEDIALLKQVRNSKWGRGYCSTHPGQEQERRSKISSFSSMSGSMYKVEDIALLKQVRIWTVRISHASQDQYRSRGYCSSHAGQEQDIAHLKWVRIIRRSRILHFSRGQDHLKV